MPPSWGCRCQSGSHPTVLGQAATSRYLFRQILTRNQPDVTKCVVWVPTLQRAFRVHQQPVIGRRPVGSVCDRGPVPARRVHTGLAGLLKLPWQTGLPEYSRNGGQPARRSPIPFAPQRRRRDRSLAETATTRRPFTITAPEAPRLPRNEGRLRTQVPDLPSKARLGERPEFQARHCIALPLSSYSV